MRAPAVIGGGFTSQYAGATDTRGARILVRGPNGERGAVPYDYAIDMGEDQHRAAVESMISRWGPRLVSAEPARHLVGAPMRRGRGPALWAWFVIEE